MSEGLLCFLNDNTSFYPLAPANKFNVCQDIIIADQRIGCLVDHQIKYTNLTGEHLNGVINKNIIGVDNKIYDINAEKLLFECRSILNYPISTLRFQFRDEFTGYFQLNDTHCLEQVGTYDIRIKDFFHFHDKYVN